ncbi:MAG: hypothetical protein ABH879_10905 [archaeon]
MVERKKEHGFMNLIKDGFSYVSQIISGGLFPQIAEGAELVFKNIEKRIIQIEERMLRKISSLMIILLGGIFLVFGLFFFQIEFLGWSKAAAFFSIGITVFVTGLILKLAGYDK